MAKVEGMTHSKEFVVAYMTIAEHTVNGKKLAKTVCIRRDKTDNSGHVSVESMAHPKKLSCLYALSS